MKPHRGVLILILGILGFVFCPFCGVAAWFMGTRDLQEMDYGLMDRSGRDLTRAGRICGLISIIILSVEVLVFTVMVAVRR